MGIGKARRRRWHADKERDHGCAWGHHIRCLQRDVISNIDTSPPRSGDAASRVESGGPDA